MSQADAIHPNPHIAAKLHRIYGLHRLDTDFRLAQSPYAVLLERLGNPHLRLPPVIHIAGTNGKGSTLAFCRALLEQSGKTVHAYTSPHLIRFNERITLGGHEIADDHLLRLLDIVWDHVSGLELTFFEFTTALAFYAMAETPADYTLLEVGMGGRLDCTNIIEQAMLTIITRISCDHMEFLGDTLEKIAVEKSGIMKPGVPCIIAPQNDTDNLAPVFIAHAKQIGAPLFMAGRDWSVANDATGFVLNDAHYPNPALHGAHQIKNAATAITALNHLPNFDLTQTAITNALHCATWPARLERIQTEPFELWFDAAHNDSGAESLGVWLRGRKNNNPERPIYLIAGQGADKDVAAFFNPLAPLVQHITLVDLPLARKPQSASQLHKKLPVALQQRVTCLPDIKTALASVPNGALVVVAGSMYLYQQLKI